ncbi:MAG TPA: hypothetical protein PLQ35_08395 [bacterium]|nr:hypothetical protein [bacterium]HQL62299.1 hypothetical protein [bacterium]
MMPEENRMGSSLQDFMARVSALAAVHRRRVLLRWSLIFAIYGLLSLAFLILAGYLTGFSFAGLNTAACVVIAGALWLMADISRILFSGKLSSRDLLKRCQEKHPETFDRLLTAQDLVKSPQEIDRLGYSRELALRTVNFAEKYLENLLKEECRRPPVEPPVAIIAGLVGFGMVALLLLPTGNNAGRELWDSMNAWWMEPVVVTEGNILLTGPERVPRGSPATLTISVPRQSASTHINTHLFPSKIRGDTEGVDFHPILHIQKSGQWQRIPLELGPDGSARYTVPAVQESFACLVTAGELASERLVIRPVDPPVLAGISWTVTPPAYTCLPERKWTGGLTQVVVPMGSAVEALVRADQPLTAATWLLGDTRIPMNATDTVAVASVQVFSPSPFVFELVNDLAMTAYSATESITVLPDRAPEATIQSPAQTADISQSQQPEIRASATDDYGLQRVLLCYEINYQEAQRFTTELWAAQDSVQCPTEMVVTYNWDLSPFKLIPGDEISYYIEAWDNDPFAQAKSGRSPTHILRSPSLADVYQELFSMETQQVDTMENIVEKQHSITEEVQDIAENIKEKTEQQKAEEGSKNSLFPEQQRLEDLQKRQEELQSQMNELQQEIGEMTQNDPSESDRKAGFSVETLEKMERIRELMSQMLDQQGKELLQKVEQVIQDLSEKVEPVAVEQMQFSFEQFEKELDRTLNQMQAAYQVRQLEGLWRVAEEMAERQDRLQRNTQQLAEDRQNPDKDPEQIARDQAALEQRQNALSQDAQNMLNAMDKLAENMAQINPPLSGKLQKMAESGRNELSRNMQQAGEKLAQKDLSGAQQSMQNARDQLNKMASELQQEFGNLGGLSMQLDLERITRLIDRTLFLSEQQERLVASSSPLSPPAEILELEVLYAQEAARIANVWKEIIAGNPFADVSVIPLMESAEAGMRQSVQISENETWIPHGPAHSALTNINEAVRAMLESMNTLMQQAAQQMGAEGFFDQLQQLIEQQQQLNQESGRLQQQQARGEDIYSQLQRMATQQARIRKELQELMRKYRHMNNLQSKLDSVTREMEDVERQIQEAKLDRELKEKQDHILTRMLEAQVSQEQDTYGKRRKAERPTGQEGESNPTDQVIPGSEQEIRDIYSESDSQFVPSRYRELVKRYFRRMVQQESL